MIENKVELETINPSDFEFVKKEEKYFDKKFETKPIGYFKDALIRFRKNRTNVFATCILFSLILLSVFVPILTTKNYTTLETQLSYLPPRVPGLEKLGIFDGTRKYPDQTVDLNTIDPETGLGLPIGFKEEYIVPGTLKNYIKECVMLDEACKGGVTVLALDKLPKSASITAKDYFTLTKELNPKLVINVESIKGENASLKVEVTKNLLTEWVELKTITTSGVYEINVFDVLQNSEFTSQLRLTLSGETKSAVELRSVELYDDSKTEPIFSHTGNTLAGYLFDAKAGNYTRARGELLVSSFRYDEYAKAFSELEQTMAKSDYDALLAANPICVQSADPNNPEGWLFPEGCPIKRVINTTEKLPGPGGIEYYSYNLVLDYQVYKGYEKIPYFFFGTTLSGNDFFAQVWLGLRTSLLIGVVVAIINITIGVVFGAIEGYYGGIVDLLMERFSEIIGRIPFLVWLSLFVIIFGNGVMTLVVLLTITGWLGIAGVTRTQFYRYKGREYVLASRTLGAKDSRLIFRHILPNGIGTIITASILMIPGVIFSESTISYLGFGIGHGQSFNLFGLIKFSGVSIGVLLADGFSSLTTYPHLTFFPAVIIAILMITFNMFGNALRDAFNPSLRGSE